MPRQSITEAQKEAREARIKDLSEQLVSKVENLTNGDDWRRMLDAAKLLRRYSAMNTMLVLLQCPEATLVGPKSFWKALGRWPSAQGVLIRKPLEQTITREVDDGKDGTKEEKVRVPVEGKFHWITTWDVSQTSGKPVPDLRPTLLTGEAPRVMWNAMVRTITEDGYRFELGDVPSDGTRGYTDPAKKLVVVDASLEPLQQLKTGFHECGHIRLGHVADMAGYRTHRGMMEVEAESVAHIVLGAVGIDTSAYSFSYLASWSKGEPKVLARAAERAVATSRKILDGIPELALELPLIDKNADKEGLTASH